jgi:mannose-6-phosphate isomerase-like protein (cupin superfamily)
MKGMTKVYFDSRNSYYPYVDPSFYQDVLPRNHRDNSNQMYEVILNGIKREASAINLYARLANDAPNQLHHNILLHALERKKANLTQFTNLFTQLTGTQPIYQIDEISFRSYQDGLQKAHQSEVEGYNEYQNCYLFSHYPHVRNVLLWALAGDQENAARLSSLAGEMSNSLTDFGPEPFVVNIEEATIKNNTFRTALWTGSHLQLTLMSIDVGEDIGLEIHPDLDQFLRIEQGQGIVRMGDSKDRLDFEREVYDNFAIIIPAGKWHNLINTGNQPLKLYSIYAPPQHPFGTIHETKEIAMAAEEEHH